VLPSLAPWRRVTASWVKPDELSMLRRLAYALPRSVLTSTQIAHTDAGVFLRAESGIESIPIGTFFTEFHPSLLIAAGYDVVPQVAPDVLARAMAIPSGTLVFLDGERRALGVPSSAFAPLETALLESTGFEPLTATEIAAVLELEPIELVIEPTGALPLRGAKPAPSPDATPRLPGGKREGDEENTT
jgi:hypothetical protein